MSKVVREVVGRSALAVIGLALFFAAYKCFLLAGAIHRQYHIAHPTAPRKEDGGLTMLPTLIAFVALAFGGLVTLAAVLPARLFVRAITPDPRSNKRATDLPARVLRFAVLHHTGVPQPHFDLMFETHPGSPLATFRAPHWPITAATRVERIADHRRDYLTLEGPLSNDRGEVRRVTAGTFQFQRQSDDEWLLAIHHDDLRLMLRRQPGTAFWLLEMRRTDQRVV